MWVSMGWGYVCSCVCRVHNADVERPGLYVRVYGERSSDAERRVRWQALLPVWGLVPEMKVFCVRKPSFTLSPVYLSQALKFLSLDPKIWRTNYLPALPAQCVSCLKILLCFMGL